MTFLGFGHKQQHRDSDPSEPPTNPPETENTVAKLSLVQPDARDLLRTVAQLSDDCKWLAERFEKLQNRVTTELREIRREVDRFYEEPEE